MKNGRRFYFHFAAFHFYHTHLARKKKMRRNWRKMQCSCRLSHRLPLNGRWRSNHSLEWLIQWTLFHHHLSFSLFLRLVFHSHSELFIHRAYFVLFRARSTLASQVISTKFTYLLQPQARGCFTFNWFLIDSMVRTDSFKWPFRLFFLFANNFQVTLLRKKKPQNTKVKISV